MVQEPIFFPFFKKVNAPSWSFKKLALPILFILCNALRTIGQTANDPALPQPIPPSPTAASLGKYGEVPVGKYTGVPDINIPLYEVVEGDIHLPISLSYHASGVRVEENASWVGLGWTLNAGGVITRSVRGLPDELGYLNGSVQPGAAGEVTNALPASFQGFGLLNTTTDYCNQYNTEAYMFQVINGTYDSEPDLYFFNFGGYSGKFVLDQNGIAYTIPYQKINIQRIDNYHWKITTPDGMVYSFLSGETNLVTNLSYTYNTGALKDITAKSTKPSFISSWNLINISSPTGHQVTFNYVPETSEIVSGTSESIFWPSVRTAADLSNPTLNATGTDSQIQGSRLSSITYTNGSVAFNANKLRQDISQYTNPNALQNIVIANGAGPVKRFVFNTDYFTTSDAVQNFQTYRLRLNSVQEFDGPGILSKPPYQFFYDLSQPMPSKISTSQDHWGYYNGQKNINSQGNPTLLPTLNTVFVNQIKEKTFVAGFNYQNGGSVPTTINLQSQNPLFSNGILNINFNGANRSPDFNFAKIGTLNKIIYPTGGFTTFQYELHDYDLGDSNYVYTNVPVNINCNSTNAADKGTWTGIVDNGYTCINTQIFTPSTFIGSAPASLNSAIYANLDLEFDKGKNFNSTCCPPSTPGEIQITDLTTNVVLIDVTSNDYAPVNPNFEQDAGSYTYSGSAMNHLSVNSVPNEFSSYVFQNVKLFANHSYKIVSTTYHNSACDNAGGTCSNVVVDPSTTSTASISFNIRTLPIVQYNGLVGGLRVHQISDYSNINKPVIRKFTYRKLSNPQVSSGLILDVPNYLNHWTFGAVATPQAKSQALIDAYLSNITNQSFFSRDELLLTSGSKFELGQTNGSYVGYSEVQESDCSDSTCSGNPLGYTEFRFTSPKDYQNLNTGLYGYCELSEGITVGASFYGSSTGLAGDPAANCQNNTTIGYWMTTLSPGSFSLSDNIYPFPPKTDYDFKRGLPVSVEFYNSNGVLVKQTQTSYNSIADPNNFKIIYGVKIATPPNPNPLLPGITTNWSFGQYAMVAAWNYKTQEIETDYDINGKNPITKTTNYFYDNPLHSQLTRVEMVNSKGENIQTINYYPGDELNLPGPTISNSELQAISELKSQFRYSTLLQKDVNRIKFASNPVATTLIERSRTGYNDFFGNGHVLPATSYLQTGNSSLETRLRYMNYDTLLSNLKQFKLDSSANTSFLWGYNKMYPIAQCKNASSNEFYFTSFEDSPLSSSVVSGAAHTGTQYYSGSSYTVNWTPPNNRSYVITYWYLNGGVWILRPEAPYTGSGQTLSGGTAYDDIRIFPSDAQMTTYTYIPQVGVSSITDPKSMTTYYEYDTFSRLMNIKDKDGNILKHTDYHYQGQ